MRPAALAGAPLGIDQRPQIVEAIGGHQTRSHQFPERGFDFRFQFSRAANDIGKERRASLPQKIKHQLRSVAQTAVCAWLRGGMPRRHPVGIFPYKEGDGRNAGGNHAPLPRSRGTRFKLGFRGLRRIQRRRMRRQPSPTHCPGETKLIQPFGIVVHDAARQHLPLPRIRRNLKALQLPQHFERAALARDLRSRRHMLPAVAATA